MGGRPEFDACPFPKLSEIRWCTVRRVPGLKLLLKLLFGRGGMSCHVAPGLWGTSRVHPPKGTSETAAKPVGTSALGERKPGTLPAISGVV